MLHRGEAGPSPEITSNPQPIGFMNPTVKRVFLPLLAACLVGFGCRRTAEPPAPLAAESIPAEFAKGFTKAKPQVKDLSAHVLTALQTNDYAGAYLATQELCAAPGASKAQKELAARALLTRAFLEEVLAQLPPALAIDPKERVDAW